MTLKEVTHISTIYDSVYVAVSLFELMECKNDNDQLVSTFEKLVTFNLYAFGTEFENLSILEDEFEYWVEKNLTQEMKPKRYPKLPRGFGANFFKIKKYKNYFKDPKNPRSLNSDGREYFEDLLFRCEEGLKGDLSAIAISFLYFKTMCKTDGSSAFIRDLEERINICLETVFLLKENTKTLISLTAKSQENLKSILQVDSKKYHHSKELKRLKDHKELSEFYFPRLIPFGSLRGAKSEYDQAVREGIYPALNYLRTFNPQYAEKILSLLEYKMNLQLKAKEQQLKSTLSYLSNLKNLG